MTRTSYRVINYLPLFGRALFIIAEITVVFLTRVIALVKLIELEIRLVWKTLSTA